MINLLLNIIWLIFGGLIMGWAGVHLKFAQISLLPISKTRVA